MAHAVGGVWISGKGQRSVSLMWCNMAFWSVLQTGSKFLLPIILMNYFHLPIPLLIAFLQLILGQNSPKHLTNLPSTYCLASYLIAL